MLDEHKQLYLMEVSNQHRLGPCTIHCILWHTSIDKTLLGHVLTQTNAVGGVGCRPICRPQWHQSHKMHVNVSHTTC
jgi:hypothetical protein